MTTTPRDLAVYPAAALLIAAVTDQDPDEIQRILTTPGLDYPALAVVLAAHATPIPTPHRAPFIFTEPERRRLHAAHCRGDHTARTDLGEREYQRARVRGPNRQHKRYEDHPADDPELALGDGQWVTRGGIRTFVSSEGTAS